MALPEVTVEQILALIQQLPVEERWAVLFVLSQDLQADFEPLDGESQAWLDADLVSDGDEYDWQEAGMSIGKPVRCVPEKGVVIVEVDGIGT